LKLLAPSPTLVDALFPPQQTDSLAVRLARDALLIVLFTGFVIICAQIIIRLPFTTVPITGQTFAVLVTGGSLGAWRGAGSLTLYMLLGIVGAPVFAPSLDMTGQTVHFIAPWEGTASPPWDLSSGGYIIGFIIAAWVVGFVAQRGWDRGPWLIVGMLIGNVLLYIPGLLWLAHLISTEWVHPIVQKPLGELIAGETTLEKTLVGGLYPFILGDLIKLYVASLVVPSAWAIINLRRRR
jgi:biotin transport system substrate-specific component